MKAVIAYRDADDSPEALELAAILRRTVGCELVVVAVLPRTSRDTLESREPDAEFRAWLDQVAADAEAAARAFLDGEGRIEFLRVASSSVAAGLIEAAESCGADVLVVGSARDAVQGSLLAGSVATRLLHSSPVPVLLAPRGYHAEPGQRFASLTCAYAGTARSREALAATCDLARRFGAPLYVGTFVPRASTMYPPEVGLDVEELVSAQWAEQAGGLQSEAVALCREHGIDDVRTFVARGAGWEGALNSVDWDDHDLLVIGSSRLGAVARVFVGSTATKILRHTPVPVLVVPAGSYVWSD
ncbi:MAG: universal stress protein [Actinobacteria bacterium]|nr:universal stress protein [Actinomycetota bacterium]